MGLLRSLTMLLLIWSFWLPRLVKSQLPAARALDALLQDYAYRAFIRPRTGVVYDGQVPSNFTGIMVSALRLRSGSLLTRGVSNYKEFRIPVGVLERPYVRRLVLVYQNLGNWSSFYYPLSGYVFLAPVLGLLAYDASNLSAKNLPELDVRASGQPISIRFPNVRSAPDESVARCVSFDLRGMVNFSNVLQENTCTTYTQGHFSIVVESIAPAPAPAGVPNAAAPPPVVVVPPSPSSGNGSRNNARRTWIIVGSVLGGLALIVLLGLLVMWVGKLKKRKKMVQMERAAEVGESLQMTRIGGTKAPAATVTRTQPTLETEYVP